MARWTAIVEFVIYDDDQPRQHKCAVEVEDKNIIRAFWKAREIAKTLNPEGNAFRVGDFGRIDKKGDAQ